MKSLVFILTLLSVTLSAQVKFTQMERTPIKWQIPVAQRTIAGQPDYAMKYMPLSAALDSANVQVEQVVTDMKYYIVSGDTMGYYYVNELLDTTVVAYPSPCTTLVPGIDATQLEVQINQGSQANGTTATGNANVGINEPMPIYTLDINAIDGIRLPRGTTGQRPLSPQAGVIRLNTTTKRFEGYNGVKWVNLSL
jgi:hypothetical protein